MLLAALVYFKRMVGIEEAPYGVDWPFGQETALVWTAWWTGYVGPIEKWLLKLPTEGDTVFLVATSYKSLPDILQGTEESDWQTDNIGRTVFEIFCFMESLPDTMGL